MVTLFSRLFIKDYSNISSPSVRTAYGILCGTVGILLNIFLFSLKFFAGTISHSVAITSDAFNNLSDAGSSIITLVGFKMAGKKPDSDHPFGHGRIEYVSGLIVSMLIILMGFELGKSSFSKILHPKAIIFRPIVIFILIISILTKIYMCFYNKRMGKKIDSAAMNATALDSLSDSIATSAVLLATIISKVSGINIDGYCGVLVSIFILYSGVKAAIETVSPLLGQPPEEAFVKSIESIVLSQEHVLGIHDLIVHDYGPGRVMVSLHAEMPANEDIMLLHDEIDNAERMISDKLNCEAVIHMDPIESDNEIINQTRLKVIELIRSIDSSLTLHDFRMVVGPTHTNVIFDVVIPFDCPLEDNTVKSIIEAKIKELLGANYFAVIQIDKSYIK